MTDEDGVLIKAIENQYEKGVGRIAVLKPSELESRHYGTGGAGSAKEGTVPMDTAESIVEIARDLYGGDGFDRACEAVEVAIEKYEGGEQPSPHMA